MPGRDALSIDVEDWYHDESRAAGPALAGEIERVGPRVERNLGALLDLLAESRTHATLFFLGEVAARAPGLVRGALAGGHEIACHGMHHRPVAGRSRAELLEDFARARALLEDLAGAPVLGFRAPCFLTRASDLWALEVVAECGFRYDSSVLSLDWRRRPAAMLGGARGPLRLSSGLWELPLPVTRLVTGHVLPCAAGGFALRALPYAFTRHHLRRFHREVGPAVLYTHPWEIDPDSPKLPGTPPLVRLFNGIGRRGLRGRLARLLREHRFAPLAEVYAEQLAGAPQPPPA